MMPRILLVLVVFALAHVADAADVARTRDGERWLVSKSQADGDWLVTYDAARATVSGSVLTTLGQPVLIDCDVVAVLPDAFTLSCYESPSPNTWSFLAQTDVARSFLGNPTPPLLPPGPTPRPTPAPTPAGQCPNIRGIHRIFGTGPVFSCALSGCLVETFILQAGCAISAEFRTLFNNSAVVRLQANLTPFGIAGGTISSGTTTLAVEGRGISQANPVGVSSPNMRYFAFDYFGGPVSGRGALEVPRPPRPGSASQAFLVDSEDLFE